VTLRLIGSDSMYGHTYRMAEAVGAGAREVADTEVVLYQVPELVPDNVLEKSGAKAARAAFARVPVAKPEQLADADAIIFGTPTRFGNMCAQMRNFLDQTGALWMNGGLIGKVGSVFASTASQHGGQGFASAERERACHRALPRQACRTDRQTAGLPERVTLSTHQGLFRG